MSKFFVEQKQIENNKIVIIDEDVNHIRNVLRYKIGDNIQVCDSESIDYLCQITEFGKENIVLEILEKCDSKAEPQIEVTLFQCLPKSDKFDLIIQKCTELGVRKFVPVLGKRVIVKMEGKDELKKIQRWQKIALEAAKQCGRGKVPDVGNVVEMKKLVEKIEKYDIVLVAYEDSRDVSLKKIINRVSDMFLSKSRFLSIGIVIGPEGGLEKEEVDVLKEAGAHIVGLGPRILRTETAGIVLTSIIMYELGDIG
jgi:RNA methyltransferase, RsmE family